MCHTANVCDLTGLQFTVKQRDLPLLEMVVPSVVEAVRNEVKRTIGVKRAADEEDDSSESKTN